MSGYGKAYRPGPELSEDELLLLAAADKLRYAAVCVHTAVKLIPDGYPALAAELERLRLALRAATEQVTVAADACPLVDHTRRQAAESG